jgi:nitrogen fixation/metabolism regulation signal transduction histidine kinase
MSKSARWAALVALVAATGVALVLGFVVSLATAGRGVYEQYFDWLYGLTVVVAALLLTVVVLASLRLAARLRQGKFGSRLLFKLAAIFALVGVLPGALVYTVSYQFVSRSIEVWFDARVESALDAGLALGRGTLDAQRSDLAAKARLAAERIADGSVPATPLALERLREQFVAQQVVLLSAAGQPEVAAGALAAPLAHERVDPALLREAQQLRVVSRIEGLDEDAGGAAPAARVRALAVVPSAELHLGATDRYLLVVQALPPALVAQALAVQAAHREYQLRMLEREGLRRMYLGTLTLALVLAVFGAVLLAVLLGNQLVRPLLLLAEGVRQVARGDLTAKPVFPSSDEIGGLTRSFADMTQQLADARAQAQRSVAELENARTHLQTILDNLTAGVVVFDAARAIDSVNPGATRILKLPLSAYRGRPLAEVPGLQAFAQAVWQRFQTLDAGPEPGERDQWQDAFELPPPTGREGDSLTLLARGATLPGGMRLLVFDDISEIVSAQRSAAWSEVARRLAHEIKNPLTPIQLSAERLEHKLAARLESADRALLQRAVATIVAQVQAMKQLVDEFRDYARLPAAQLQPLDLNALVAEVLVLYGHAAEAGRLRVHAAAALPAVLGDATQLRQVVHNLVQNGLDAVAERADGCVQVATEIARDDDGRVRVVRLVVSDNGPGFADKVLKRAFEPYVTTKSRGTGLGLAVVKKIADEHGARVRIGNAADGRGGARVSLSFSNLVFEAAGPHCDVAAQVPAG